MMKVTLIVAYGRNRAIGKNNKMPWHLPADLAHFKRTTLGHPVIMGRNTFESIGRPLPGRRNIVVSRSGKVLHEGVSVAPSLEAALAACSSEAEVFVLGGAQIFVAALPLAQRIIATEIDADFDADVFFPAIDRAQWRESARAHHAVDEKNAYALDFVTYDRVAV
jgi:dihydrofolate reductase